MVDKDVKEFMLTILAISDSIGETGRLFQDELWSLVVKLENKGDWIVGSERCWHSIVRDKEGR